MKENSRERVKYYFVWLVVFAAKIGPAESLLQNRNRDVFVLYHRRFPLVFLSVAGVTASTNHYLTDSNKEIQLLEKQRRRPTELGKMPGMIHSLLTDVPVMF